MDKGGEKKWLWACKQRLLSETSALMLQEWQVSQNRTTKRRKKTLKVSPLAANWLQEEFSQTLWLARTVCCYPLQHCLFVLLPNLLSGLFSRCMYEMNPIDLGDILTAAACKRHFWVVKIGSVIFARLPSNHHKRQDFLPIRRLANNWPQIGFLLFLYFRFCLHT